jgi:hypothetical protein
LDKEEADFVSKYLALADQLLKQKPEAMAAAAPQETPTPVAEETKEIEEPPPPSDRAA